MAFVAVVVGSAYSEDNKNKPLELAGMKSTPPADWKEETPSNAMRQAQYKLPKAEKDKDDAELALFAFPGGSGSLEANLKRQVDKFVEEGRKDKVEKIKVGGIEASYQDVTGTFMKKAFPMAKDFTKMENYRQLYVVFEAKDGKQYYMTLLGPKDTVEKHKKGFEEFLKNFK
jgi:hypothetical protein